MRTVILEPAPVELDALIERRRRLGQDILDEVWSGDYHMAPVPHPSHGLVDDELAALLRPLARAAGLVGTGGFNLGDADNYRVPDRGLHREIPTTTFVATAAVAIEIVSLGDETWDKLDHYAAHGVEELLIVDPRDQSVRWFVLEAGRYEPVDASPLLGVSASSLREQIDWPPVG